MKGLSVIIPSRSAANLLPCAKAVRQHEPDVRIIVIDDGLPHEIESYPVIGDDRNLVVHQGADPFIFARNCNLGIEAAGTDDVILLNDDALLETSGGFSTMQRAAEDNPQYGLISATTNVAGNPAQHRQGATGLRLCGKTPGNSCPVVAFVCVLIPRRTIELVGMLDQRFTAYGWDDNDYCRRVHHAGQYIGICDGCFVDHAKLKSTFRGDSYAAGSIEAGRQIYLEKWGKL